MKRSDFLRLVALTPLAKLVGWEPKPDPFATYTKVMGPVDDFVSKADYVTVVLYDEVGGDLIGYWPADPPMTFQDGETFTVEFKAPVTVDW